MKQSRNDDAHKHNETGFFKKFTNTRSKKQNKASNEGIINNKMF